MASAGAISSRLAAWDCWGWRHWPYIGSVVDYLADQRGERAAPIARNIGLPWRLSSRRPYAAGDNAGPYGAWLGRGGSGHKE